MEPTFEDFRRLFLFAHLEPQYRGRAWVIVDGDDVGQEVVDALRGKYQTWPAELIPRKSEPAQEWTR